MVSAVYFSLPVTFTFCTLKKMVSPNTNAATTAAVVSSFHSSFRRGSAFGGVRRFSARRFFSSARFRCSAWRRRACRILRASSPAAAACRDV